MISVARSLDESATLEGTASQASLEGSTPWGKKNGSLYLYSCGHSLRGCLRALRARKECFHLRQALVTKKVLRFCVAKSQDFQYKLSVSRPMGRRPWQGTRRRFY